MSDDIKIVGLASPKMASKTKIKIVSSIIGVIVLAVGVIAGMFLVRQNQNINKDAACVSQCPSDDNVLMSCHDNAESGGGDTLDSSCNAGQIGRIEICGQTVSNAKQYCCTANGWKTNLTSCSVATPTSTATVIATSTATATATSTATATATSTGSATTKPTATATVKPTSTSTIVVVATATAIPVPVTGASMPTILGAGFGVVMLLVSLGLAL